jgi:hypothetical protein
LQAVLVFILCVAGLYYLVATGDSIGDVIFKLLFGLIINGLLMWRYMGYLKREESRKKKREEEHRP